MYVAVDVGGTKIKIAFFTELRPDGLKDSITLDTQNDYEIDTARIVSEINKSTKDLLGLAIALPGFTVDKNFGVRSAANLSNWENKPLKQDLNQQLKVKSIFLLHDAEAHALSELVWSDTEDKFMFIAWGTGIGGTFIRIDKDQEVHVQQIELGYQHINGNTLEGLVGGINFEKNFGKPPHTFTTEDWSKVTDEFAKGISNILCLNYPKEIIWGGGIAFKQPHLIDQIMKKAHNLYPHWALPKYKMAQFNEDGAVIGCIAKLRLSL